jgi:hypothetical protein
MPPWKKLNLKRVTAGTPQKSIDRAGSHRVRLMPEKDLGSRHSSQYFILNFLNFLVYAGSSANILDFEFSPRAL